MSERVGAACDISTAVEFLMVATKGLAQGKDVADAEVQQYINWAIRKLQPLDQSAR